MSNNRQNNRGSGSSRPQNVLNSYASEIDNRPQTNVIDVDEFDRNGVHYRTETSRVGNTVTKVTTTTGNNGTFSRSVSTTTSSTTGGTGSGGVNMASGNDFGHYQPFLNQGFLNNVTGHSRPSQNHVRPVDIYNQQQQHREQMRQQQQQQQQQHIQQQQQHMQQIRMQQQQMLDRMMPKPQVNRQRGFVQEIIDDEDEDNEPIDLSDDSNYIDLDGEEMDFELQQAIKESMNQSTPSKPPSQQPPQKPSLKQLPKPTNNNRSTNVVSPVNKRKNKNVQFKEIQNDIDDDINMTEEGYDEDDYDDDEFFNDPQTQNYLSPNDKHKRQERSSIRATRQIMNEQDREFQESLKKDREKAEQEREKEELEKAIQMSLEMEQAQLEKEKADLMDKKKQRLPPDPTLSMTADQIKSSPVRICEISILPPDGQRFSRKFFVNNNIQNVRDWIDVYLNEHQSPINLETYELVTTYPKSVLSDNSKTLEEFYPRTLLNLREP
ncbi:UBX domain-containing protein [Tieghemostelium lacteum]|uniref:UBX domain-containing protein n=1 Tax=Tieghemostelium lacteum TaxID=361077 RepID=A0A151Z707_TIELA|nr:UBX domain-containing protein [Tieghemostelium lacteum]|eukprot:KYQ89743.1 UBX domain-containing protein [Tieghemostelium lacteum]